MSIGIVALEWHVDAACRGPQSRVFFPPLTPERRDDREVREAHAKAICGECPVLMACRDHALSAHEPHGIWGGLNEQERRAIWDTLGA